MIHAWYNKSFQIHHGILHTFLVVQHGRSKRTKELWPCLALGKSERRGPAGSQGCDISTEVEGNPTSFGEPLVCEPSRPPEAGQGLEGEVACPSAWYTEISPVGVTWNFLRDRETKGLYHTGNLDLHGKPFRLVKADYQFYQHWFDAAMCEKLF